MRPLPALALTALLTGCAYDWAIGASADGGIEAGAGGSGTGAGPAASSTSTGVSTSSTGSGPDAGPSCATLLADLDSARKAAKACTLGASGQCATSVIDECHCTSYVTQGGSSAAAAFAAAVQKVEDAGCPTSCKTCLQSVGACLLDNGMGPYCVP